MGEPATFVPSADSRNEYQENFLFKSFPEPLFLINGENAKKFIETLIKKGIKDFEKHFRQHPEDMFKFFARVKFIDTNPAAIAFYRAQNKLELFKAMATSRLGKFNLSFSPSLENFIVEKKSLEVYADYGTLTGKSLHLNLKVIFLDAEQPSFDRMLIVVNDITEQVQSKKIEQAIYKISEFTHKTYDLQHLYAFIHKTVNELVLAKNFYIALADYDNGLITFPYSVDECDDRPQPIELGQGITSYVLKTGKSLLATPEVADELVQEGEVVSHGTESVDWLGVPLVTDQGIIGVLAVQTYNRKERLSPEDMKILQFVSTQIAMAIERKTAEEEISKFKTLSDSANYGIAILDLDGTFIYCNSHYAEMHGVTPSDILNRPFPVFETISSSEEYLTFQRAIQNHEDLDVCEIIHTHKDGHQFPTLMNVVTIRDARRFPLFTALTAVDITTRKQQNEDLRRYANRLEALHQLDHAIRESRSPDKIAAAALEHLYKLIRFDHASVLWVHGVARRVNILAAFQNGQPLNESYFPNPRDAENGFPLPIDQTTPLMKNLDTAKGLSFNEEKLKQQGIKIYLSIPLQVNKKLIGLVNLGAKDQTIFTKTNMEIIQEVGHMLSIALQQADLNQQIQQMASIDDLTRIFNRRQLLKLGQAEFKRAQRYHKTFSVIMFDPDNFKAINDTYGHLIGDQVLVELTRRAKTQIRETDIFGRYGGDEFIIFLPETPIEDARLAAERLQRAVNSQEISTEIGSIPLSISLGVTERSDENDDNELKDIINRADVALYAAKRSGRNRITVL